MMRRQPATTRLGHQHFCLEPVTPPFPTTSPTLAPFAVQEENATRGADAAQSWHTHHPVGCFPAQAATDGPQQKMLSAYRLSVNGIVVSVGPGRGNSPVQNTSRYSNSTVPVNTSTLYMYDSVDITAAARAAASQLKGHARALVFAVQCYHHDGQDDAKFMLQAHVQYAPAAERSLDAGQQLNHAVTRQQTHVIVSDDSWQTFDATGVYNPVQCLGKAKHTCTTGGAYPQPREYIDAAAMAAVDGWQGAGFVPGDGWVAAQVHSSFKTAPLPKSTEPIAFTPGLKPVQLVQLSPGHWFFDFGSEIMAGLRLRVTGGVAGQKLDITQGEETVPGAPHQILYPMRTGNTFQQTWTLQHGISEFENHEYSTFRYGEIKVSTRSWENNATCGEVDRTVSGAPAKLHLYCKMGATSGNVTMHKVLFASYGMPSGSCEEAARDAFKVNSECNAAASVSVVEKQCLGKGSCELDVTDLNFGGDPCPTLSKKKNGALRLAVQVQCKKGDGSVFDAVSSYVSPAAPAEPLQVDLSAWVVNYPWKEGSDESGSFNSSNAMLNNVWDLCKNTLKVTSLDTTTDSNTRERLPYEADGYITGDSALCPTPVPPHAVDLTAAAVPRRYSQHFQDATRFELNPLYPCSYRWQTRILKSLRTPDLQPI